MSAPTLFAKHLTDRRLIEVPAELDAAGRKRFLTLIRQAVRQQADLAAKQPAVLRISPEVEVVNQRVVVRHEPAAACDPAGLLAAERPGAETLWWVTSRLARALAAAHEAPLVHGGIQPATVFQDAGGLLKLGDFGIVPAYEGALGGGVRRRLVCELAGDPATGGGSGRWQVLSESDRRDFGWMQPFLPQELLEDEDRRLNLKSDQFSLGVLLFLWATGHHPYGAALSEPTLLMYFYVEPFQLEEERPEWAEAFERQAAGLAGADERAICAWADLVQTLLRFDEADRFANLDTVLEIVAEHERAEWRRAEEAATEAEAQLAAGLPDEFLSRLRRLVEDKTLPAPWRARLGDRLAEVEQQKDAIVQRQALQQRLNEAREMVEQGQWAEALAVVEEVSRSEARDEQITQAAEQLRHECTAAQRQIEETHAALVRSTLESIRETIARGDLTDARLLLNPVMEDSETPEDLRAEARELRSVVDQQEERARRWETELAAARREHAGEQREAALLRLNALLNEELPEAVATAARGLRDEIQSEIQLIREYGELLDQAEQAWRRAEVATLREMIAAVPEALPDAATAQRRAELDERCRRLEGARQQRSSATQLLEEGRIAGAQAVLAKISKDALPELEQKALDELMAHCRARQAEVEQQQREEAAANVAEAERQFAAGDLETCAALLESDALTAAETPADLRKRAEAVQARLNTALAAIQHLDEAEQALDREDLPGAAGALATVPERELPEPLRARLNNLRIRTAALEKALQAQTQKRLAAQVDEISKAVAAGDLAKAERLLARLDQDPQRAVVDKEQKQLRKQLDALLPLAQALDAAEAALQAEQLGEGRKRLEQCRQTIQRAGEKTPAWAARRLEQLTQSLEHALAAICSALQKQLDQAARELERGDAAAARRHLEDPRFAEMRDETLERRQRELTAALAQLDEWTPRLERLEKRLEAGEWLAVQREVEKQLAAKTLPAVLVKRARAIGASAAERIAAHRAELDQTLSALERDLTEKSKLPRDAQRRLAEIETDEAAIPEQRQRAAELRQTAAASRGKRGVLLPALGGVAALLVLGAVGVILLVPRGGSPTPPDPDPEPPPELTVLDYLEQDPPRWPAEVASRPLVARASPPLATLLGRIFDDEEPPAIRVRPPDSAAWQATPGRDCAVATLPATLATGESAPLRVEACRQSDSVWDLQFALEPAALTALTRSAAAELAAHWNPRIRNGQVEPEVVAALGTAAADVAREAWASGIDLAVDAPPEVALNEPDDQEPIDEEPDEQPPLRAPPPALTERQRTMRLSGLLAETQTDLAALLQQIAVWQPAADPALQLEPQGDWSGSAEDDVRTQRLAAASELYGQISVSAQVEFTGDGWGDPVLQLSDPAPATIGSQLVAVVAERLAEHAQSGRLAAIWQDHAAVEASLMATADSLGLSLAPLERILAPLPPAWDWASLRQRLSLPTEWHPSAEVDANLGYPLTIQRDGQAPPLRLVHTWPDDARWQDLPAGALAREWQIFYVASQPRPLPEGQDNLPAAQAAAAALPQGRLPTRAEWTLAALTHHTNCPDCGFLGGRYEWCLDGESGLVTGGRPQLSDGLPDELVHPPAQLDSPAQIWNWLQHPLVTQRRAYGDDLTAVRAILPLWPEHNSPVR